MLFFNLGRENFLHLIVKACFQARLNLIITLYAEFFSKNPMSLINH